MKMRLFYLLARGPKTIGHSNGNMLISDSRRFCCASRYFRNTVRATNSFSGETWTVVVGRALNHVVLWVARL